MRRGREGDIRIADYAPTAGGFRGEVLEGLGRPRKELPCKYFYDRRGAELFERICELDEYYPTRVELGIMTAHVDEMAALSGPGCAVIEYGSGSGKKTRMLLDRLRDPAAYVPIDISREQLLATARALGGEHPGLEVLPVVADYTGRYEVPEPSRPARRRVVYFPGSTIGNFDPPAATRFLRHIARQCGQGGALLVGVDLRKDPEVLHRAYNDAAGVTAEFNKNLLARINREIGADFVLDRFRHYAFFAPLEGRIEMHLVSLEEQRAEVAGVPVAFERGESIWTESSYKYTLRGFASLAAAAGLAVERVWTDPERLFSVQYLTVG
jgi:dimethylhistidine N-methyltransferase